MENFKTYLLQVILDFSKICPEFSSNSGNLKNLNKVNYFTHQILIFYENSGIPFGQNKFMTIGQKSDFLPQSTTVTTNLQGFIYAVSSFKFSSLHHSGENYKFTKERLRDNSLNLQKNYPVRLFWSG